MYIFLDVDGVLNTKADWKKKMYYLNPSCTGIFCDFLRKIKTPRVVLSSTWRNGIARDGTTAVHIEDLVKALRPAGISGFDKTANAPDGSRSREIDYYLRRHPADRYIILDDDPSLFEKGESTDNLYLIDPARGFTANDARKILHDIK